MQCHAQVGEANEQRGIVGTATAVNKEMAPQSRCNIQFKGVGVGQLEQPRALLVQAGHTIQYSAAKFENEAAAGIQLRIPEVTARLIIRDPDGDIIDDIPNAAWIRQPLESPTAYMKLEANHPQQLALLWLAAERLVCHSVVRDGYNNATGRSDPAYRVHVLNGQIGTIEIQLLTNIECLYRVLLRFQDDDDDALPVFTGVAEAA